MAEISPELRAVLACAQAVVDDRHTPWALERVAACPDADRLCRTAVRHGMLGLLRALVVANPDAPIAGDVRERLNELGRAAAARSLRQTVELLRLLEQLDAAGIPAMPIKGPAWGERLYGDPTLRSWVDLDILVPFERAREARHVLLNAGLADVDPYASGALDRHVDTWGQVMLTDSRTALYVDLHWQAGIGLSAVSLPGDELLARGQAQQLLHAQVIGPSDVDVLLMTCTHGSKHQWNTVELLLQLAVLVDNLSEDAWPAIMAAAESRQCRRQVTVGVSHACRVFGLARPRSVSDDLARDRLGRWLVALLTPTTLTYLRNDSLGARLRELVFRTASEDSWLCAVRHTTLRLLLPGPEDWREISLPERLTWVYWPLRPLRLVAKWARRAL